MQILTAADKWQVTFPRSRARPARMTRRFPALLAEKFHFAKFFRALRKREIIFPREFRARKSKLSNFAKFDEISKKHEKTLPKNSRDLPPKNTLGPHILRLWGGGGGGE